MDNVINKTKELISTIDNTTLINNLDHYKFLVLNNTKLLELIKKYNNTNDDYIKISLKKEIYNYKEYQEYMKYYNELFYYIIYINSRYKKYTTIKECNK